MLKNDLGLRRNLRRASRPSLVIESDPEILGGKPVIRDTRIPVDLVLELIDLGYSPEAIVKEYPELSKQTIVEVLRLAKTIHESVNYEKLKAVT